MTIEERLKKLTELTTYINYGWLTRVIPGAPFIDKNYEIIGSWKFTEFGITKDNLRVANLFWDELYKVYKLDKLKDIVHMWVSNSKYIEEMKDTIKELEQNIQK